MTAHRAVAFSSGLLSPLLLSKPGISARSCSIWQERVHVGVEEKRRRTGSGIRSVPSKGRSLSVKTKAAANGLSIDLSGKKAFVAGIADDQGFGWAIAKALCQAGAEVSIGVWVPVVKIFESSFNRGKFDETRQLSDGSLMEFKHIYPMDAVYDLPEDVPQEVAENKRYAGSDGYTISEVAEKVRRDSGNIDILIHSLANGPEVTKPLLETSRSGYLAAVSSSSYSYVSMLQRFGPIMSPGSSALSLSYVAADRVVPGYGGGMSSAKAALESDTRMLAYEAGQKYGIRVNSISAGPLGSRAAKAIGFIDMMIAYSFANSPVQKELKAEEVGNTACFLCSPLASAITGQVIYVDNGLSIMSLALDSAIVQQAAKEKAEKGQ